MTRRPALFWTTPLLAALLATGLLSGCLAGERMCSSDEYPVYSVEFPESGRACVSDDAEPPAGYARYPEGRVPEYASEDYNPADPS